MRSSSPVDVVDDVADVDTLAGRLFWDAPLPSLIVDVHGKVVHANDQVELTFGWPGHELVGKPVEVLVPGVYRERHIADRATFADEAPGRPRTMGKGGEVTGIRRDGTEIVVEVQISQLVTSRSRYFLAVARDVTARRREAEQLARANVELRERAAAYAKLDHEKNALLGMVAHDLRTPIAVIVGYAELLATLSPSEPLQDHREIVDVIENAAKMMRRIVDDLLDWTAIEAGTLRLARHAVDPVTVAADAIALAGLAAARLGVDLTLEQEPGLPAAELDPGRISQVLGNLLGNALKHSTSGMPVSVHVGRAGDDAVEYTVSDRGDGIPQENLSQIFGAFETGTNPPIHGEHATGLGLAIVKRIVDAHGGRIGVESVPGVGSTFRVTLPIRAPQPSNDHHLFLGK